MKLKTCAHLQNPTVNLELDRGGGGGGGGGGGRGGEGIVRLVKLELDCGERGWKGLCVFVVN